MAVARMTDEERLVAGDHPRAAAAAALAEVFELELEPLPAEDGAGLWAQPIHEKIAEKV